MKPTHSLNKATLFYSYYVSEYTNKTGNNTVFKNIYSKGNDLDWVMKNLMQFFFQENTITTNLQNWLNIYNTIY